METLHQPRCLCSHCQGDADAAESASLRQRYQKRGTLCASVGFDLFAKPTQGGGDGIVISARFPASKTPMLAVQRWGLHPTRGWMRLLFEDDPAVVVGLTGASVRY